jgi:uncharacterized protein YoxC
LSVSTDAYTSSTAQAREAAEQSVESWKRTVKVFTDQAGVVAQWPRVDLREPVSRYFEFLQQVFDANRDLATGWAELVTSLSDSLREQTQQVSGAVTDEVDAVADLAVRPARQAEELAREQAERAEESAREQEREAKRAERAAARQERQQARERYEGLTKAELSDQLAERGLPKTGNVDELVDRLVTADTQ